MHYPPCGDPDLDPEEWHRIMDRFFQVYEPHIPVERAELARLLGDAASREPREAHRLFVDLGATGHAAQLAQEIGP